MQANYSVRSRLSKYRRKSYGGPTHSSKMRTAEIQDELVNRSSGYHNYQHPQGTRGSSSFKIRRATAFSGTSPQPHNNNGKSPVRDSDNCLNVDLIRELQQATTSPPNVMRRSPLMATTNTVAGAANHPNQKTSTISGEYRQNHNTSSGKNNSNTNTNNSTGAAMRLNLTNLNSRQQLQQ